MHITQPALSLCIGLAALLTTPALAQAVPGQAPSAVAAAAHDGRHDFDFELGTWKAHVKKLVHPLSGSLEWDEFDGVVVTRPVLGAGWNESEMKVDSPRTRTHLELIAVRLYNPRSRQWGIYGANAPSGVFDPPQIGQFAGTRGEFYAQDLFEGRAVYIRYLWQNLGRDATHFEQAFSVDGGRSWETNWIYDGSRAGE
jgi:hypothetical protein